VRKVWTIAAVAAAALALALPGAAITNGELDGNGHPSVGAYLVKVSGEWRLLCTGTLVSPRVFLTASHCTSFAEANGWPQAVSFDSSDVENTNDIRPATSVTNPDYKAPYTNDVSLLLLEKPTKDRAPMPLASVGYLDELEASGAIESTEFVNVGYGTEEQVVGGGPATFPFDGYRRVSTSSFQNLRKEILQLWQKENVEEGGTCYGDSGGPTLVGSTVVAVVSTGDGPCWSTGVNTRVDTQEVRDFLAPYLALN
jgi:secreted trypsin-like serine protease